MSFSIVFGSESDFQIFKFSNANLAEQFSLDREKLSLEKVSVAVEL